MSMPSLARSSSVSSAWTPSDSSAVRRCNEEIKIEKNRWLNRRFFVQKKRAQLVSRDTRKGQLQQNGNSSFTRKWSSRQPFVADTQYELPAVKRSMTNSSSDGALVALEPFRVAVGRDVDRGRTLMSRELTCPRPLDEGRASTISKTVVDRGIWFQRSTTEPSLYYNVSHDSDISESVRRSRRTYGFNSKTSQRIESASCNARRLRRCLGDGRLLGPGQYFVGQSHHPACQVKQPNKASAAFAGKVQARPPSLHHSKSSHHLANEKLDSRAEIEHLSRRVRKKTEAVLKSLNEAKTRSHSFSRNQAGAFFSTERIEPRNPLRESGRVERLQREHDDIYKFVEIKIRGKPGRKTTRGKSSA